MKKLIIVLFTLTMFGYSCKINEPMDNEPMIEDKLLINLNIINDFILNDQSVDLLIHDFEGNPLSRQNDLKNRNSYEFEIRKEDSPVLFSLVIKTSDNTPTYRIKSFITEEDISYTFGEYENRNISEKTISIEYDKDEENDFVTSSSSTRGNGTTLTLTPKFFPPNEIITYFDKSEQLRKLINIVDPQSNETFILDNLNSVPVLDSTLYEVNEEGYIYSTLYGKRENIDNHYILLSEERFEVGKLRKHYLPIPNINDFVLWTEVDAPDIFFGTYDHISEFELSYTKPEIDLNFEEVSLDKLNLSSSNGDFFKTTINNISGSSYFVFWDIHGTIDSEKEISIPNLDSYLLENAPSFKPENAAISSTTIYKTTDQWSYDEFISFSVENITKFNIPSTIEYYGERH